MFEPKENDAAEKEIWGGGVSGGQRGVREEVKGMKSGAPVEESLDRNTESSGLQGREGGERVFGPLSWSLWC